MNDSLGRLAGAFSDRYRIEREIGAGGMATVYLAEDLKHHRKGLISIVSCCEKTERVGFEPTNAARRYRFSSSPERFASGCVWLYLTTFLEKNNLTFCVWLRMVASVCGCMCPRMCPSFLRLRAHCS